MSLEEKEFQKIMEGINEQCKRKQEERLLQQQINKIQREKQIKARKRLDIATLIVMVLMIIALVVMFVFATKNYENNANACDDAKGYICSDYEVRQYAIKSE